MTRMASACSGARGAGPSITSTSTTRSTFCAAACPNRSAAPGDSSRRRASVIDYLRFNSKQTIFSAAISPGQAGCASAALDVIQQEPQHLDRLWRNVRRYRTMLKGLGLDTWGSETPAIPIVLGSKELVYRFWQALLEKGVFTVMSIAPAVPPGKDLVRTAVSALHNDDDLDRIAEAMAFAVKQL